MSTKIQSKFFNFVSAAAILGVSLFILPVGASADPLRVSESEAQKSVVQKVRPDFPALARQLKLSGRVVVDLLVGEDGAVEKADVVTGNPILGTAAKNAGKAWKFQPFTADGKPSKALVRVNFDFTN